MIYFGNSGGGNGNGNGNDNDMGNLLNLISILLGYENLIENRQQSADNDINASNQRQAKQILDDLHAQFNVQNAMLEYQNQLLEEILKILKGER